MKRKTLLCIVAILSIVCRGHEALAALIVDWGGPDYVGTVQYYQPGGFSGGDPLPIYPATGYNLGEPSARFYGQVIANAGTPSNNYMRIVNGATDDFLEFKTNDNLGSFAALLLWTSPDFIGDAQNSPIKLGANSVSMGVTVYVSIESVRMAVRIDDEYYISEQAITTGAGSKTINPVALSWFEYDPATVLTFDQGSAIAANIIVGGEITDVTEVGFYVNRAQTAEANNFRVSSFEVDAVPVPEPSTYALLGLGIAGLAIRRRMKRAV